MPEPKLYLCLCLSLCVYLGLIAHDMRMRMHMPLRN